MANNFIRQYTIAFDLNTLDRSYGKRDRVQFKSYKGWLYIATISRASAVQSRCDTVANRNARRDRRYDRDTNIKKIEDLD